MNYVLFQTITIFTRCNNCNCMKIAGRRSNLSCGNSSSEKESNCWQKHGNMSKKHGNMSKIQNIMHYSIANHENLAHYFEFLKRKVDVEVIVAKANSHISLKQHHDAIQLIARLLKAHVKKYYSHCQKHCTLSLNSPFTPSNTFSHILQVVTPEKCINSRHM